MATSAASAPEQEIPPCDLDNDGQVGLGDLAYFSSVYGEQPGITTENSYAYASDFDGSGTVDISDLGIFASQYGQDKPESSIASPAAGQPTAVAPQTASTAAAAVMQRVDEKVADDDLATLAMHWLAARGDMDNDDDERDAIFKEVGVAGDAYGLFDE